MAQAIVAAAHDCSGAGGGQAVRAAWPVPGSSGFGKPVLPAAPSRAQHKDTQTAGRAGTGCRRVSPRDQGRVAAPAVKRLTIVPLLGTAASLFGAAACGETVATSPTDTTPPTVGLDTFGIPLPAGATTRENPLSVDRACCDLSRTVGNDQLSFIAGAATRTLVCGASAYMGRDHTHVRRRRFDDHSGADTLGQADVGEQRYVHDATSERGDRGLTNGGLVPREVARCPSTATSRGLKLRVWAEAENYAGQKTDSKVVTLLWSR
jgi:hypothetical protein